jgi:hypothetical protein
MTTPAAARTGSYGRRVYPVPQGEAENLNLVELPSVSDVLKVLDAPALNQWKLNTLAEQFALHRDLVMLAASSDTRRDAIRQALDADRSKANIGTAIHGFTESVDNDTLDWSLIPEVAKPWVEHYAAAKEKFGWRLVEKEVTVFNHAAGYAGTTDRFMEFPEGICCADVKTGANVYADQALQLSMYANGEGIWTPPDPEVVEAALKSLLEELEEDKRLGLKRAEDGKKISAAYIKRREAWIDEERWRHYARLGERRPMPEGLRTDLGYIIHLSETGCELIPMNLSGAYDSVKGICAVYHWKRRSDILGKPLEVSSEVSAERLPTPLSDPIPDVSSTSDVSNTPHVCAPDICGMPTADSEFGMPDPLEPTGPPVPSSAPTDQQLFDSLRARLIALPASAKEQVAFSWPNGAPGLKTLAHTRAQLDEIDTLIFDVECKIAPEQTTAEKQAIQTVRTAFPDAMITEDF